MKTTLEYVAMHYGLPAATVCHRCPFLRATQLSWQKKAAVYHAYQQLAHCHIQYRSLSKTQWHPSSQRSTQLSEFTRTVILLCSSWRRSLSLSCNQIRSGLYPVKLPIIPGYDGGGEIVTVGSAVPAELGLKQGDLVVYVALESYAEYTAVPAAKVVKLPEGVDLQTGIAAMIQGMTGVALAINAYTVAAGDWVIIFAASGGTGTLITQVAAAAGARVIGVASTEEKAKLVKSYGAEHTLLSDDPDLVKKVLELTGGQGVTAVFDGVGAATWEASKAVLGYGGTLVSFGNPSGKIPPVELNTYPKNIKVTRYIVFLELQYKGIAALAKKTLDLVQAGKLKINIHKVYSLAEAAQAHQDIEGRKAAGKILLDTRAVN